MKLRWTMLLGLGLALPVAASAAEPIACRLDALNEREHGRRETLVRELIAKARVEERANGYHLEWSGDPKVYGKLVEFIGYERRCCPFFEFEVRVSGPSAPVTLLLHGTAEVKAFLKEAGTFDTAP